MARGERRNDKVRYSRRPNLKDEAGWRRGDVWGCAPRRNTKGNICPLKGTEEEKETRVKVGPAPSGAFSTRRRRIEEKKARHVECGTAEVASTAATEGDRGRRRVGRLGKCIFVDGMETSIAGRQKATIGRDRRHKLREGEKERRQCDTRWGHQASPSKVLRTAKQPQGNCDDDQDGDGHHHGENSDRIGREEKREMVPLCCCRRSSSSGRYRQKGSSAEITHGPPATRAGACLSGKSGVWEGEKVTSVAASKPIKGGRKRRMRRIGNLTASAAAGEIGEGCERRGN